MFLDLLDPDPEPLVRGLDPAPDPDPEKPRFLLLFDFLKNDVNKPSKTFSILKMSMTKK
jgi:hypothetical protein